MDDRAFGVLERAAPAVQAARTLGFRGLHFFIGPSVSGSFEGVDKGYYKG